VADFWIAGRQLGGFAGNPAIPSWICTKETDQTFVNFDDACKFTNGEEFAKAVFQDEKNPNSWYCEKKEVMNTIENNNSTNEEIVTNAIDSIIIELLNFPSSIESNYQYDLTKMSCSVDKFGIDQTVKNLMSTSIWPVLMKEAEDKNISFEFCNIVLPNNENQNPVKIYNTFILDEDKNIAPAAGLADFENNQIQLHIFNIMDSSDSRARTLGHEMQHFFDDQALLSKFPTIDKKNDKRTKEICDSLEDVAQNYYIEELRGKAIEDAMLKGQKTIDFSNQERNFLETEYSISKKYNDYINNYYEKEIELCQKSGFLLNKHLSMRFDETQGMLVVEIKE